MSLKPTPLIPGVDLFALSNLLAVPMLICHDPACTVITGNAAANALFGTGDSPTPAQLSRSYTLRRSGQVLEGPDQPMHYASAHGVTVHDPELELIFTDGEVKFITGYAMPLYAADNTLSGVLGVYMDITEQRRLNVAQRIFARVNSDLEADLDEATLMAQLAELLLPDLADCCMIDILDVTGTLIRVTAALTPAHQQTLDTLVTHQQRQGASAAQGFATERDTPLLLAQVRSEHLRAVAVDAEQLDLLQALRPQSALIMPIVGRHGVMGNILMLMNDSGRSYSTADLPLAQDVATRTALLLDNARLYAAERQARTASEAAATRALFLADLGSLLADVFDADLALQQLTRLVVPRFADLCVVFLAEPDASLRRFAVAHSDPTQEQQQLALQRRAPFITEAEHPAMVAISTRQTLLDPDISPISVQATSSDPAEQNMTWSLIPQSHIVAPLIARGRVLGALSFGLSTSSGRRYDADDRALAEDLARRTALAVDNARLYHASQEAVRTRDTFLSVASHELKTPLTSLLGQAQLIQRRMRQNPDASERDQRSIATVVQQGLRLSNLISAMLDISRLETGQLSLVRAPVDLVDLVRQVAEELQPTLVRHTLRCELPAQPLVISGDLIRLMQVLHNLLQNAIKYSPDGGLIVIRLAQQDDLALMQVIDQGIGIPSAALAQLFQRFYRAEHEDARHISGLGVGLYVVREVITLHGGQVSVASVAGQGSTFSVTLPLAETALS